MYVHIYIYTHKHSWICTYDLVSATMSSWKNGVVYTWWLPRLHTVSRISGSLSVAAQLMGGLRAQPDQQGRLGTIRALQGLSRTLGPYVGGQAFLDGLMSRKLDTGECAANYLEV